MIRPKISCFRHKNYNDIYINNVLFSLDKLILLLDILPKENLIILIEAETDIIKVLSNKIQSPTKVINETTSSFISKCTKKELLETFNQININNIEGIFVTGIKNELIPDEYIKRLENLSFYIKNIPFITTVSHEHLCWIECRNKEEY